MAISEGHKPTEGCLDNRTSRAFAFYGITAAKKNASSGYLTAVLYSPLHAMERYDSRQLPLFFCHTFKNSRCIFQEDKHR